MLTDLTAAIRPIVDDYELIVVENGSSDTSIATLSTLTAEGGLPNLQVYGLTNEVDSDTVAWVGLENALGDFIAVIDPMVDDINFLSKMLECAAQGTDIVYASNETVARQTFAYRICRASFNSLYKLLNGVHLANEASQYRLLSKRVVNFILQHPLPALTYRRLPATAGFSKANLTYRYQPTTSQRKRLSRSIDQSLRLLVAKDRGPMRLVTTVSCAGALLSFILSTCAIIRSFGKRSSPSGWLITSFQQSGILFLNSLAQFILGEYVLQTASVSGEGPAYHVAVELTSALITRRSKLNVESGNATPALGDSTDVLVRDA